AHARRECDIAFNERATFQAWPDVPIHVVVGRDDRFFPGDFQARVARERLGKSTDEVPGGHLVALSRPRELAKLLIAYAIHESRRARWPACDFHATTCRGVE